MTSFVNRCNFNFIGEQRLRNSVYICSFFSGYVTVVFVHRAHEILHQPLQFQLY